MTVLWHIYHHTASSLIKPIHLERRNRRAANDSAIEGPCVAGSARKVSGNFHPI
jgi:hypothetical protein